MLALVQGPRRVGEEEGVEGRGSAALAEATAERRGGRTDRPSDEELLSRVSEGKVAALGELYDRHGAALFALAARVLRDRGAAEEAVQDAFLAAWRKAGSFDAGRGRAYGWLAGITRNRAVDELRRRNSPSRWPAASRLPPEAAPDPGEPEDHEGAAPMSRQDTEALARAVRGLPGRQREVVELAYYGGLSQREISSRLGVPLGTVKTRARLALGRLREALDPEPPLPPRAASRGGAARRDFPGAALAGREVATS